LGEVGGATEQEPVLVVGEESMARVEWTRQTGDDVEAVVGMFICTRYPNAVRVQPSQGDGGLDIYVSAREDAGVEQREVYQVKSFTERLTSSRKRQISRSLQEAIKTAAEEGWRMSKWHLVMPLDLTDNELRWFHEELPKDCDFDCEIHGLLFCDTLAAQYPKVVDYYLRDGRERLQDAVNNLTAILAGRNSARQEGDAVSPSDLTPDLTAIYKALNGCDPFYKYEFSASDAPPAAQPSPAEPDVVAVHAVQQDSVWITIKIKALSMAGQQERPVGAQFSVAIPEGDDELRDQFQRFIDYGAPVTLPTGTVTGFLDLPGGLGGELSNASLQIISAPDRDDEPPELCLAIFAPDSDTVIASTIIKRTELSSGRSGVRSVFTEKAGLFTLEMTVEAGRLRTGQMSLEVAYDLAGALPADIVDGLQVLSAWRAPNRLAFGLTYGPPNYGVVATDPISRDVEAARWAPIAKALVTLQDHVSVRLRMPTKMTKDQALEIIGVAKMVSGEPVTGKMSGSFEVTHAEPPQIDREFDRIYEFAAIKTLKFELGDQVIEVGKQALFFLGKYVRFDETTSEIEPTSDGVSIRYTGDVEVTRIAARHFRGTLSEGDVPDGTD
jgi:hypothetical protein